jgi:hypothetical protein
MERLHFKTTINAPAEKVYEIMLGLRSKSTYELWTSAFNETSTYEGSWDTNSKILFLGTTESGEKEGMVSKIVENSPVKFVSIQHLGLFKAGKEVMEGSEVEKWAGGYENYYFEKELESCVLRVELDTIEEFADYMNTSYPKALDRLKSICEQESTH